MTGPTVREVLESAEVARGHPRVLAGRAGLDREVTWVHVLELGHARGLLKGGELVLLTGVALPDSNDGLRAWVADLDSAGASAAVVQLGERWSKLPIALVRAAEAAGLPLVALQTEVPFVEITRSLLGSMVHSSYAAMQRANEAGDLLHRLALEGRTDVELVTTIGWLAGTSVVLEGPDHHVLAFQPAPGADTEALLRDWERRSRHDGAGENWVIGEVRARGRSWGRLIGLFAGTGRPTRFDRLTVERGAENLALRRLTDGSTHAELDARAELLAGLVRGVYRHESEGRLRAEAAGFPTAGRRLVGIAVLAPTVPRTEVTRMVAATAAARRLDLLLGEDGVGLVSLVPEAGDAPLVALTEQLGKRLGPVIVGLGEPVGALGLVRDSVQDAMAAARAQAARGPCAVPVRLGDVRVRGLLAQLADEPRLQSFVERELGPLLVPDHATELAALRAYLEQGRNKSAGAGAVRVSRPAFYSRLRRAGARLGADLDDPETCLSLQLAVLAHDQAEAASGRRPDLRSDHRPQPALRVVER